MNYFTAKGDSGTTKLFSCPQGVRLSKGDGVFEVLGGVDELNCFVGWCRAVAERSSIPSAKRAAFLDTLRLVQEDFFIIQAELGGGAMQFSSDKVTRLETAIVHFADGFPKVSSFVIPGATELGALLDVARTVARRVERLYIREREVISSRKEADDPIAAYLNRMSSLLYVLARYANHAHGVPEQGPSYA